MKNIIKKFFPVFISLISLLLFEMINNVTSIAQKNAINLQVTGNIIMIILSVCSIVFVYFVGKQMGKTSNEYFLNGFAIVVSAFVLNIDVFHDEIEVMSDFFSGWHAMWSAWFIILVLWFTGIGKATYNLLGDAAERCKKGVSTTADWAENAFVRADKGIMAAVGFGIVFWIVFLIYLYKEKTEVFAEEVFERSLYFWLVWFVICTFIFCFAGFGKKIVPFINNSQNINILNCIIYLMIGTGCVFLLSKIFPDISSIIQSVLGLLTTVLAIIALIVHAVQNKKTAKNRVATGVSGTKPMVQLEDRDKINKSDLAFCFGVIVMTTGIIFALGAITDEGKNILTSGSIEDYQEVIELITVGMQLITELF